MPSEIVFVGDSSFFNIQAPLDGVTYTLQFRWNVRLSSWFMDVLDEQGINVLLAGLRLVINWPLALYQTGRTPPGDFLVFDTSGVGIDPGLNDLGDRCRLWYFSQGELLR